MIEPTSYRIRCDHVGCEETLTGGVLDDLIDRGLALRWQVHVRADGTPAIRNGKCYCPDHRRGPGVNRSGESPTVRFLVALALSRSGVWRPVGGGEWSAARTAHSRGLLEVDGSEGGRFRLTARGWDVAAEADARVAALRARSEADVGDCCA